MKVYNDVNDNEVFMKVLYYPHITKDDYSSLTKEFSNEFSNFRKKNFFSFLSAFGASLFSWTLAYRYHLKPSTFAILSLGSFGLTYFSINSKFKNQMKRNCNNYALTIAAKYPDIKYLKINYTESDKLDK